MRFMEFGLELAKFVSHWPRWATDFQNLMTSLNNVCFGKKN